MKLAPGAVIDVVRAEHLGEYALRLEFSDGAERLLDFLPFLEQSRNPMIRAYLDPDRFARFRVDGGDLLWGDYDLCFSVADLYEGKILR